MTRDPLDRAWYDVAQLFDQPPAPGPVYRVRRRRVGAAIARGCALLAGLVLAVCALVAIQVMVILALIVFGVISL